MTTQLNEILGKAFHEFQGGNYSQAETLLESATQLAPNHFDALHLLAVVLASQGKHLEAVEHYRSALLLNPESDSALSNLSSSLNALGLNTEAIAVMKKALTINPGMLQAWFNAGNILSDLGEYQEALSHYAQAEALKPDFYEAYYNHGKALVALHLIEESLVYFEKTLSIHSGYLNCIVDYGAALKRARRFDDAIAQYDLALRIKPNLVEAWLNKGNALHSLKRYPEALEHYNKALQIEPNSAELWLNKGTSLSASMQYRDAIDCYDKAISLNPKHAQAWFNRGVAFNDLKKYPDALASYQKASDIGVHIDWMTGASLHTQMKMCLWDHFEQKNAILSEDIRAEKKVTEPFPILALTDDPALHRLATQTYALEKFPVNLSLGPIPRRAPSSKIRIGYFSADFNNHAVAILTAQLFETHSRDRFEIIAFSLGADDHSPIRQRLSQAFDQFIDASQMSDRDIAQLARQMGIDIAVDLGGFTGNARMGIFAYRAAPIQLSYIGYLGTLGVPYMDYLIADSTIIPPGYESYYCEKIVRLPSYQVNDSQRKIADTHFTRAKLGLPEEGFVFACFNNNYKILPATFDSWMRILTATPGSVLFLYAENTWVKSNLQKEAKARGVEPHRLVFGERLPADEYLARYQACDLFLDTLPYNAGTTASDALWAGLPVLTLMGQSFASRVAASLLNAIGLPELITTTPAQYEAKAIALAQQTDTLAAIKAKLAQQRLTAPLFDTPLFTQHLESAYQQMMERYQAGLGPEDLTIV